ncbi:MAG: hypothetical protein AABX19_05040, partial [Nanoarchaeota archaeon]
NSLEIGKKYPLSILSPDLRNKIIRPNLLLDIQKLLKDDFNVYTILSLRKIAKYKTRNGRIYVSSSFHLSCVRKEDIKRFHSAIGFYSTSKKLLLDKIIKEEVLPKDMAYQLINLAIKFKREKGSFRISDIQKYLNFRTRAIRTRLTFLVKLRILENNAGEYTLRLDV